jgi:hypothetical protein
MPVPLRIGLSLSAAAFIASGCFPIFTDRADTVYVQNNTDVTLHFTLILADGRPFDLPYTVAGHGTKFALLNDHLLHGVANVAVDSCTVGDLFAYGPDGREVARHGPGLCGSRGDTWVIGASVSPSPSGGSRS